MSQTNVVLCYPVLDRHLKLFSQKHPGLNFVNAGQERIDRAIFEADIFVGHAKVPVDWPAVVSQGRLKFIQSSAAGLDHCLVDSVIASDITVASASGLFAQQVCEQTVMLLMGLIRSAPIFWKQQLDREFIRQPTDDLIGKRIGIVGLGGNGRRIADVLHSFDVEINAVDYFPVEKPDSVNELRGTDDLLWLARRSDVVIVCTPLNSDTKNLIDATFLSSMPVGGYLVNVARGKCVDEMALIDSLSGDEPHLKGAGLDVVETEPLPKTSPLWELANVIITPHVGAQSARRVDSSTKLAAENIRRFLGGEPIINQVDKRLGFPHPTKLARNYDY